MFYSEFALHSKRKKIQQQQILLLIFGSRYSRIDQVRFVENNL